MAMLKTSPLYIACAIETSIHVFARKNLTHFLCEHTFKTENVNTAHAIDFIEFSPKFNYFVVLLSDKSLVVWKTVNSDSHWEKHFQFSLNRRSTSAAFSPDEKTIFVADKSGDLYNISMTSLDNELENSMKPILGHVSILLHVSVTDKYIITTDRDEKIRISLRDQPYNIQCFCLGHTEFVCNSLLHGSNCLISSSGDGTLRSWNINDGSQICVCNVNDGTSPADFYSTNSESYLKKQTVPALLTKAKNLNLLAVGNVGINSNIISVYSIEDTATNYLKSCYQIKFDHNTSVVDISFDSHNQSSSAILFTLTVSNKILKLNAFSCLYSQYNSIESEESNLINTSLTTLSVANACQVSYLQLFKNTVPGDTYETFHNKKRNQFKKVKSFKRAKLL